MKNIITFNIIIIIIIDNSKMRKGIDSEFENKGGHMCMCITHVQSKCKEKPDNDINIIEKFKRNNLMTFLKETLCIENGYNPQ